MGLCLLWQPAIVTYYCFTYNVMYWFGGINFLLLLRLTTKSILWEPMEQATCAILVVSKHCRTTVLRTGASNGTVSETINLNYCAVKGDHVEQF